MFPIKKQLTGIEKNQLKMNRKIDELETQGNELLAALGFGGFSTEPYREPLANIVEQARISVKNSTPLAQQELSFNLLEGFVQILQTTANAINAKNNELLDNELFKSRKLTSS